MHHGSSFLIVTSAFVAIVFYLKVAEVTDDVSIFLLVALVLESENWRDEVREAQELGNDSIPSGNYPEDGLAAQVVLRQEVHHGGWRKMKNSHTLTLCFYSRLTATPTGGKKKGRMSENKINVCF